MPDESKEECAKKWFGIKMNSLASGISSAKLKLQLLILNTANEAEAATEHTNRTLQYDGRISVEEATEFYGKMATMEALSCLDERLKGMESAVKFYSSVSRFDVRGAMDNVNCCFADANDLRRREKTYHEMIHFLNYKEEN